MTTQKYLKLAPTGDNMPLLGFGTWRVSQSEASDTVYNAIKCGYRLIDGAAMYCNEQGVGAGIKRAIDEGIITRKDLFVTSKLANTMHSAKDVEPACRKTLSDLGLEYLDLYLVHWPFSRAFGADPSTFVDIPVKETWTAMEDLVRKGLVRNIGVSNFTIAKLKPLLEYATVKPAVNQVELHLKFQQGPLVKYCRENNIVVNAYRPLCFVKVGENLIDNDTVKKVAAKYGKKPSQVILAWGIQKEFVVIPKSAKVERMKDNFGSLELVLAEEDMAELAKLDEHLRTCTASEIFGNMTESEFWDNE